ncbi:MAG: PIG-L family deacetylase [Armatimonadota bacterium]|nr:PIG-L family deacetylase [bacterium]MDW8322075.1 PIG-L family deacetylase [Armatimonadota bacterium]
MRYILAIGAHPDDVEGSAGGTLALMRQRGDRVLFLSVTDGGKGHYQQEYALNPRLLVERRMAEARCAAALIGAEFQCLGAPDGGVYVNHETTSSMIRAIRSFGEPGKGPDLILVNRPNDYHRDHRATAQLVLDAAYLLTVPLVCADVPALRRMPVIMYWHDDFTEPVPFRCDVVVDIDSVMETKIHMVCAHESQFSEWIPYTMGMAPLPLSREQMYEWVTAWMHRDARSAKASGERGQPRLAPKEHYKFAEGFQISEYGTQPTEEWLKEMFRLSG